MENILSYRVQQRSNKVYACGTTDALWVKIKGMDEVLDVFTIFFLGGPWWKIPRGMHLVFGFTEFIFLYVMYPVLYPFTLL